MTEKVLPEGENVKKVNATTVTKFEAVDAADVVSGNPEQGTNVVGELNGVEVGVWELREGVVTDTEVDELFVVLAGSAIVEILGDGDTVEKTVEVQAGDAMRLVGGTKTRWTVTDFIRKVYIA